MHPTPRKSGRARSFLLSCGIGGLLLVSGCGNSNNSNNSTAPAPTGNSGLAGCADTDSCASNPTLSIGGERPAKVLIPSDYNTATRYPLAVVLHGYGATGEVEAIYLGLDTRVDTQQYILVMPDGTENLNGTRYWNATPGCCAFTEEEKKVDDVAYIRGLIEEAAATYSIDTTRIGLIGHSNGGFMALRLVCEASDLVTSVVSLAGSTFIDDANCAPATNPVSVLTMHGTADGTIFYDGGANAGQSYPGARETIARYAAHAGCDRDNPVMAPNTIDVIASIPGNETEVLQYTGCPAGIEVTLWTMVDGPHIPFPWVSSAIDSVVDWAIDHPRS